VHGNVYTDYIGSNLTTVVTFAIPTAIGLPTGGDASRPGSAAAGQLRYNSDRTTLEFYNGSGWVDLTSIITVQQFNGDGVNATFNLNSVITGPEAVLVNINGTVQQPGIAYSIATVGGVSQITFAETPQTTDAIDIRFLSTGAETLNLSQYIGNIGIQGALAVQGNIMPAITNTYMIGNATNKWNSVYSNAITVTSGVYWANGVPFASSTYSNANVTAYLPSDPTIQSIQANIFTIGLNSSSGIGALTSISLTTQANLGAYQIYANANIGTLYSGNIATQANIGTLYNTNISTQANLGAYQIYANANAAAQALAITSLATNANANTAAYLSTASITTTGNIQANNITVTGNITSVNYETITYTEIANIIQATGYIYTSAYMSSPSYVYSNGVNILNSVGVYQTYANANIGTLYQGNISTQANIGAYQTWANATITAITYSNANVISNLQHFSSNITTTATTTTGNLVVTGLSTVQQTQEVFTNVAVVGNSVPLNFNNGAIFYCNANAATSNFSANLTNIALTPGYTTSVTIIIPKTANTYYPNVANINSSFSSNIQWQSGIAPSTLNIATTTVISLTMVTLGSSSVVVLGGAAGYQ